MKTQLTFFSFFFFLFSFTISFAQTSGRIVHSFNADWQFMKTEFEKDFDSDEHEWNDVSIPHTWNDKDAQTGEGFYRGTAWYRKSFNIEKDLDGKRVYLRFEGVGNFADLYVNGTFIGTHKGSYAAFCFEITHAVRFGDKNQVYVRANNEARPDMIPPNQFLFTIFGGIYRPVSLIITDKLNITPTDYAGPGIYIRQEKVDRKSAAIHVKTKMENKYGIDKKVVVRTTITDRSGKKVAGNKSDVTVPPLGLTEVNQDLMVKKPRLWHGRKDPYLYTVVTEVVLDGKAIDRVEQPLGIRYFHIDKDNGFYLNGEPYRLYGVCRHQEWEDYGNALSNEQHKTDFELIHEIGARSVRLAHYQQAEYVYSLCDSLGLVVWAEIPFVNDWMGEESENVKQQLIELIRQNYNHPSIVIWGLHNEIHNDKDNLYPTYLTRTLNNMAKSEDPDRYTVSVSNIWWLLYDPIHYNADLQGFNQYTGWYGGKPPEIEKWINNFRKKFPDTPVCISEYGAGGNVDHQREDLTNPPDPGGKFFPETYQTYYHEVKWAVFKKYDFLWATYLWNMFDFTCPLWERGGTKGRNHKGLITYDRKLKKDAFFWYKANWSDEPLLYITGRRFDKRNSEKTKVTVYCNVGIPVLEVNGQVIEGRTQGGTDVHFIWENVTLKKGENKIKAHVIHDGKRLEDGYEVVH